MEGAFNDNKAALAAKKKLKGAEKSSGQELDGAEPSTRPLVWRHYTP